MRNEGECIKGSLVNEFGFSMLDFVYDGEETNIVGTSTMLDRRKIRKILSRDLSSLFEGMTEGRDTYVNEKKDIKYRFTPLER